MKSSKARQVANRRRPQQGNLRISNAYVTPYIVRGMFASDPFPPHRNVSLNYVANLQLTNGAAGVFNSTQQYRLNSLYDPDHTGAGHQPYGYDQITAIYQKYKVYRCDVELTFWFPSQAMYAAIQFLGPDDASTLTGMTPDIAGERPTCELLPLAAASKDPVKVRKTIDIARVIGMTRAQFDADLDGTCAQQNANPLRPVYMQLAIADPTSTYAQGAQSAYCQVKLVYHARVWSRHTQAQS
jgi:hypothetical protein